MLGDDDAVIEMICEIQNQLAVNHGMKNPVDFKPVMLCKSRRPKKESHDDVEKDLVTGQRSTDFAPCAFHRMSHAVRAAG